MNLTAAMWIQESVVLVDLRMVNIHSVGWKCHLWLLFWWRAHKTKDSVLARKAELFRWVVSPRKVPKEEAKSRGAAATRAQLGSLLSLDLWALSFCRNKREFAGPGCAAQQLLLVHAFCWCQLEIRISNSAYRRKKVKEQLPSFFF